MAVSGGIILSSLSTLHRCGVYSGIFPGVLSQVRHYAARKGTREKAKKKKVKVEVKKLSFADKIKKSKKVKIIPPDALLYNETSFPEVEDDVYFQKLCAWKKYSFAEAIQCHREWLHPTMYNSPSSIVSMFVELNFKGLKPTKPVETFRRIIPMKHSFDHGEDRKILVFAKSEEDIKDALDTGAALAGGADIVKLIVSGEVSIHNYDTVLAHPSVMPEILTIRGLLKRKHPNLKAGTMGPDIKNMVYTHLHGIKYAAEPFDHYPEYGRTTVPIGKLDMDIEHLEDNMKEAIASIMKAKPKRPGSFITRIRILCPPSLEKFKINEKLYVQDDEDVENKKDGDGDDNEEGEEEDTAKAVSL